MSIRCLIGDSFSGTTEDLVLVCFDVASDRHSPTSPRLSVPSLSGQAIQNPIHTPCASPTILRSRGKPLLNVMFLQLQRLYPSHRRSLDWTLRAFHNPSVNVFCSLCSPMEFHSSHQLTERPYSFVPIVIGRNQSFSSMLSIVKRDRPNGTRGLYWWKNIRVKDKEKFRTEHVRGSSFRTQTNTANV